jgi:hypothetical protein
MSDLIQPEQPRKEFKNYSGNFLNIRPTDLAPSNYPLFVQLNKKQHVGGKYFADNEEVETEIRSD